MGQLGEGGVDSRSVGHYAVWSTTLASAALRITESMPFLALALVS
jgi:hypothetical protein